MHYEPNYFGLKLGEAINAGAGHISDALQRKYEIQRRQEELLSQQNRQDAIKFEGEGIDYDPNNPQIAHAEYAKIGKTKRGLEEQKTQAEIKRMGRESKAPTGYEFVQGGLQPISGGPADYKIKAIEEKKQATQATALAKAQKMTTDVDSALEKVGHNTSGFLGNKLKDIAGTESANLKAIIETIQANLGFDRLTQMRAESPTGGALGNVSDRELRLLTSAAANLNQDQSPEQLKQHLNEIKAMMNEFINRPAKPSNISTPSPTTGWTPEKEQRLNELRAKAGR